MGPKRVDAWSAGSVSSEKMDMIKKIKKPMLEKG